ncbi:MAG: CotH kinase family protein [Paludibacteraceae bacterium]|nr:CotH kinase family protein [Paludibacteraceae bacterium]
MDKKNLKLVSLLSLLMTTSATSVMAEVVLNELMPCNISSYRGSDTNYSGWVELYNDGDAKVDIKGYVFKNLKKGGSEKWSWTVSQSCVVQPDDYAICIFDEKEKNGSAPYKLDPDGGTLILYNASGKEIGSLKYGAMVPHISYGIDDEGNLGYMEPTPKKDNTTAYASLGSRCGKPVFGTQPGIVDGPVSLTITSTTSEAKIYYTLDGSEPSDKNGTLYDKPIEIKRQDDQKSIVVRARAIKKGLLSSAVMTGSYIFMDDKHKNCNGFTVPIVSLAISKKDYSDNTYGIGVVGTNGISNPAKSCLSQSANYNQDWMRPANFEYIVDGKTVLSQETEVGVVGGCSRTYTVKSLKVNVSKKTGNSLLKYPFFGSKEPQEFKSLHIRNGGNGYNSFMIRDALLQEIARSMGLDCQHYQPVAYYINGEYKGMMGLRTRSNKDLVYAKYGVEQEDLDVIEVSETGVAAACGTMEGYEELIKALKSKDKSSPTFLEEIGQLMDIDYYIDYQIFEQYIVNTDWPGNNTKLWRERQNGRFRWIVYDVDFGFGLYEGGGNYTEESTDMIQFCLGKNPVNWANKNEIFVEIFKNLMENQDFRERFMTRYLYHLDHTFKPENLKSLWSSIESQCKDEFCASPISHDWDQGWDRMNRFAENRPAKVYEHLRSYYNGGNKVTLRIAIKDENGNVIPNSNIILNNVSTGASEYKTSYFSTHSMRVEPRVPVGYTFKKWTTSTEVASTISTTPILTDKSTWSYYFKDTIPSEDWAQTSYDASSWKQGSGSFGINSKVITPTVKLVDGDSVHYITSYYRAKFKVSDLTEFDSLLAKVTYDDGVVIYLNGKEVKRYNMPKGTVTYGTFTPDYLNDEVASFFISKKDLVEGENVIAAEVHQYDANSADMTFALTLSGVQSSSSTSPNANEIFEGSLTGDLEMTAVYSKNSNAPIPMLQLNEVCASNNSASGNSDEYGNYPDWIEIYNAGTTDCDLAGMYLSDNRDKLEKSQFPYGSKSTIIKPGEHKIIYADNSVWRGALHADFKISAAGGFLALSYNKQDKVVVLDSIKLSSMEANDSYGREFDGSAWTVFSECEGSSLVTFGSANPEKCEESLGPGVGVDDYIGVWPDEVEPQGIDLYPNPAHDWIVVKTTGEFDNEDVVSGIKEVSIYSLQGVLVAQSRTGGATECRVSIDQLAPGIYYLKAVSDRSFFTTTFKKQ